MTHSRSPDLCYEPSLDEHINIPTLMCSRMPEISLLLGSLFSFIEHGRDLLNVDYLRHVETRHCTANKERRRKQKLFDELAEELMSIPKKKKFKEKRQKLEVRLEGLKASTPERGLDIHVLCQRETPQGIEHVTLDTAHIIGLSAVANREELEFVAARVRHGKISFKIKSLEELRDRILMLERDQSLPHLWRGLPSVYGSIFGLCYTHQLDHELSPGTCYYARVRRDGESLYTSGLLLEQCGYRRDSYQRGKLLQLQIELLKRITVSGEHGGHHFDDVPLLEEEHIDVKARDLPKGVRSGRWATLCIPRAIWKLQGEQFTQVPAALLRSHDLYMVNLGLVLKGEEGYKQRRGEDQESVYTMALERLIDQAGLRQVFRAHHSRDEKWLGRALGDLEAIGVITHLESEELERIISEPLPTQLELSFDEPVREEVLEITPTRARTSITRRQFPQLVQTHRKVTIHLYQRVWKVAMPGEDTETSAQAPLPSTSVSVIRS